MLLPTKHISFSQSVLGLGYYLVKELDSPKTVDSLWKKYKRDVNNNYFKARHSFDELVLALVFLYSLGIVCEDKGVISKCV